MFSPNIPTGFIIPQWRHFFSVRIIGSGFNSDIFRGCGSVKYDNYGKIVTSTHAEVDAIHDVGDLTKLRGATMYITRRHKASGDFMYSAPCCHCQLILKKMQESWGLNGAWFSLDQPMDTDPKTLPIAYYS